ncbi:NUDIX domain-containing protein [Larkinella terrae]|uniref:NUDIX domain-containing protein n=1 Tax=Larkinella terrae TaxID=2025311 RepID=A0A7K0EHG4_9BACT|nr:NUDIX domain-containing protein [Larkinella terrae]MRS61247.1 NUDIX domain-containing protein [Larkinella terrae]
MKVRPAVLLIENNHLLLMQYRYGEADVYGLPGGNPDKGETLDQTVLRELQEELGVDVEVGPIAFVGEVIFPEIKGAEPKEDVLHVVFAGELIGGIPQLNPDETTALAVTWKPVQELDGLNLYPNVGRQIQRWLTAQANLEYIGKIDQAFF